MLHTSDLFQAVNHLPGGFRRAEHVYIGASVDRVEYRQSVPAPLGD